MSAPDNIFASPDIDDGWRWIRASLFPEQGPYENVAYTRTAAIPDPMDDPRVVALVEAMKNVAEQSTRDEIPDGYGPDHIDGFDDGYDAAIMNCRAALSAITKEPPHER